ncbi:UDP-N-acetylmuramate--L-alanine ligase [Tenacibaculum sp. UWU-22]|uniref:UDP-N-acetylmuramate--L-alanine ligase n=1 Tax=Tenacibaculum sp. UWU-22 TaxID=3234187 RepID=UPI0034DAE341
MNLKTIHNIYFIGIGGIGMSAIARYFAINGKRVAGYDKTPTPITTGLQEIGIEIHFNESVKNIPVLFLEKQNTIVVYTPAISKNHEELSYFIANKFRVLKRAEILGKITQNTFCLAVAGTHGKTTTTAILGHIMQPLKATSFLGGISENYHSNLILGEDKISVVEADEFDRSFLQLSPNIACITSIDADHLDIYNKADALQEAFIEFASKVLQTLIVAKGIPVEGLTYAVDEPADYYATNIKVVNGTYFFDVVTPSKKIEDVVFHLPGRHNLMNALAATAMADVYGVDVVAIKKQLSSFKGVQRRFSYKIKTDNLVLIDDYAHHPTEISAVENSIREMYPNQKALAVFQPHLFSRTQDFVDDFAKVLSRFDQVILLEIYPAREMPIKGVDSTWLLDKITLKNKQLSSKEELIKNIQKSDAKIVTVLGAGDIGLLVNDIQTQLKKQHNLPI